MQPILELTFGGHGFTIPAYRACLVFALVGVPLLATAAAASRGLSWRRVGACLSVASLSAPVGARVLHGLTAGQLNAGELAPLLRPAPGDFSLYGGLALAGAIGFAMCRWFGEDPLVVADAAAPALGLGIAVIRVGCFLAGCCFGVSTDLPWGVTYPVGSGAHLHQMARTHPLLGLIGGPQPVHPLPLYEVAIALAGAALADWVRRRSAPPGAAMAALLAWYSAWRLLLHPLRAPPPTPTSPEWLYPAVYLAAAVAALAALRRLCSRRPRNSQA